MASRRGLSLVELLIATALTTVLIGTMTSLYAFTMTTSSKGMANNAILFQARSALDEIESVVRSAQSCSQVTDGGKTGLMCVMPYAGVDRDGDGMIDRYTPLTISKRGLERWGQGRRIWFYTSDSTGEFGRTGTILWRAYRNDTQPPTAVDADRQWAYYYDSGSARFNLIQGISFTVDTAAQTVSTVVLASTLTRAERTLTSDDGEADGYSIRLARTAFWGNWRK